jgi:hypothetical protein
MREALATVVEAIRFRRPGHGFYTKYRFGKTTMVIMIGEEIREIFPHVAVGVITAQGHDKHSEKVFWTELLESLGLAQSGTANIRKDVLRTGIVAACQEHGGDQYVLIVDEAQTWGADEFHRLRDFISKMQMIFKITVTTIVVGDPTLQDKAAAYKTTRGDLYSRFFREITRYPGITSLEMLKEFMSEYDAASANEYPPRSGICYTEFFLPDAYAAGWRLAEEAEHLWEAIEGAAKSANRVITELGMEWIGLSILSFLTVSMSEDGPQFRGDEKRWGSAVATAKFDSMWI